jgi:hypothetical protein
MHPSYVLFPTPEGGKTRLGGKLQREEQLLTRTGMCTDRDGTVDDLSEGVFQLPFPPTSCTTGVAHEQRFRQVRLDQHNRTSLADQRPRRGLSRPRIVETSDTFYFIQYPKNTYISESNKYIVTCMF